MMAATDKKITEEILIESVAREREVDPARIQLESIQMSRGAPIGDNYACDTKQVDLEYRIDNAAEIKSAVYFIKLTPLDQMRLGMMDQSVYQVEFAFYDVMVHMLQDLRSKHNLPALAIPKCYYQDVEKGIIVLENIKCSQGYESPSKSAKGIGRDSIECALVALAEWHATGYHLIQSYDGGIEQFVKDHPEFDHHTIYDTLFEKLRDMFDQTFEVMGKIMQTTDSDHHKALGQKVQAQKYNWWNKGRDPTVPRQGDFMTLLHGDAWFKNMMLRCDPAGDIIDAALVDYQLVAVGTPLSDLNYFFGSSANPADLRAHLDSWLRLYHTVLVKSLTAFGYSDSVYTYAQLKQDVQRARYHCFMMNLWQANLVVITPESADAKDFDFSSEANKHRTLENDWTELLDKMTNMALEKADKIPHLKQRIIDTCEMADELGLI